MKRTLTPEEKKLWERVAQSAKPLLPSLREATLKPKAKAGNEAIKFVEKGRIAAPLSAAHNDEPLNPGAYANIDRNTAERFRKGKYEIDATLDLHGLSRDKAQMALHRFLKSHYERGSRCLLVITGKGLVLRESLPRWLAADELRPMILAFDTAKQKHGGSGAFYILLRRKRQVKE